MPRSPSGASARRSPRVLIKSLERNALHTSQIRDMVRLNGNRSNRPFGVKHFQTVQYCSVDVAHGLALLFGIGTQALPSWDSRTRRNNLLRGLTVRLTIGPSGQANSPHPSSREGHLSTA